MANAQINATVHNGSNSDDITSHRESPLFGANQTLMRGS
jgi:hypothetical protein